MARAGVRAALHTHLTRGRTLAAVVALAVLLGAAGNLLVRWTGGDGQMTYAQALDVLVDPLRPREQRSRANLALRANIATAIDTIAAASATPDLSDDAERALVAIDAWLTHPATATTGAARGSPPLHWSCQRLATTQRPANERRAALTCIRGLVEQGIAVVYDQERTVDRPDPGRCLRLLHHRVRRCLAQCPVRPR